MGFLESSFSPLVWLTRKSILGKHFFFYWATEWALKYHNPTRLVELAGLDGGRSKPQKKIRLVNRPSPGRRSWPAGQVRVWKNSTHCHSYSRLDLVGGSRFASRHKLHTCQACQKLKHHANWSTTGQKVQTDHSVTLRLELVAQSSCEAKLPANSVLEKLTFRIRNTHKYKYPLYP